jgi:DNA polymerase III epsilon subunit-like protein
MSNLTTAVIMDTETTGLLPTDEICSLSWLAISNPPSLEIRDTFSGLFDISKKEMPFVVQKIHKISKEMLRGKPRFTSLEQVNLPSETEFFIFHNAAYDWYKMLKSPIPSAKVICTLDLAKKLMPFEEGCSTTRTGRRSYKLVDLCSDLYPEKRDFIFSGAHGAEFDCKLTYLLIRYFFQNWEIADWDELYNLQA